MVLAQYDKVLLSTLPLTTRMGLHAEQIDMSSTSVTCMSVDCGFCYSSLENIVACVVFKG